MRSDWKVVTVEQLAGQRPASLATGPFGSSISSRHFTENGVPVIRGSNLSADVSIRLDDEGLVFVSPQKAHEFRRSVARRGDLVFTCWGTINQVGLIDETAKFDEYIVSNKQMKLTVDPEKADARFLYYVFSSPQKQREILENGIGSSVPGFNLGQLKGHELLLPPLPEQRAIAGCLKLFDDRIDLLRQTNATLESIAQAIFKSWFIDFDPVRAKEEGRELDGMNAATAALFPAEFEESALGLIPKGWRAVPFTDTVHVLGGGTPKTTVSDYWGGETPWFSVVDAPSPGQVFTFSTEKTVTAAGLQNSSTRLLPAWTTIISARGTIGKLAMCGCPMAMNQSCYGLRPKLDGTEHLVYLSAQRLVVDLKRLAHGGVFDTITKQTLSSVTTVQATAAVELAFAELTRPFFEQIGIGVSRIATLVALRDSLLPRLISGTLCLPSVMGQLEGAIA